jgi:transcriptional regulator with XRE-family HTH domain
MWSVSWAFGVPPAGCRAGDDSVRAMYEEGIRVSENGGRNPRQVFGAMVRFYREKAGLSRAEVGRRICKSGALVEAIELGRRAATPDVTGDLEAVLDAGGALAKLREEMKDGLGYLVFPSWFADWPGKEATARDLRWYELHVVPGLLQTEDYARAIFGTRFRATSEEIDELVAARMKRQEVLEREQPPGFWVILDEAVLHRPVGGRHVMAEQIRRLVEAARRPGTMIQVIPAATGAHEGLAGSFGIASFDDQPNVGYLETALHGQPVESEKDVAALELMWDTLRGEALPRGASLALLEEAAKSWTSAT